jgi:hypothetical protein
MKKIILIVLPTVLATFLGQLVWEKYKGWDSSSAQLVSIDNHQSTVITTSIKKVVASADVGSTIHDLVIWNDGTEDVENLKLQISDQNSDISWAGGIVGLAEAETPDAKLSEGVLELQYKIMKKGEGTRVWYVSKGSKEPVVRSVKKGVEVTRNYMKGRLEFDSNMIIICSILLSFFLGLALANALMNHVLKRIGFEPAEINKAYAELSKKKP